MGIPSSVLHFFLAWVAGLVLHRWWNRSEFRQHPQKGKRYAALPSGYKHACSFVVVPAFAAAVFHGGFLALGFVSLFLLESACVRWYRNAGLY